MSLNDKQKWIPQFLRRQNHWKVLSGKWESNLPKRIIYHKEPRVKTGENIAIIGSKHWNFFTFHVKFKILNQSIKPPDGGIILYFLFKNIKNYYSIHFCLFKQKIEFIKRFRGFWSTLSEQSYNLETQQDYSVMINTISNMHQCLINGTDVIQTHDTDIYKGCIGIGVKYCDVEFNHASVRLL